MLVCRPAVQVDDRGRRRAVLDRFLVRDIDEGGDRETVLARVSKVHRLDERLGIDPTRQGRGDGARLHMGRFPYPRVERSARAAVHVRHRLAVGCDAWAHVHAGKVRDGVVRLRRREDATDAQLGVLTMKVKERATVGTPDRVGGVKGRAVRPLDARDRAVAQRGDRDLVVAARVRGERELRPVGGPARADGFADGAAAGLEAYGLAAGPRDEVQVGDVEIRVAPRAEDDRPSVGRPARLEIGVRPVGDGAGLPAACVHHEDAPRFPRTLGVEERRAVRRPRERPALEPRRVGELSLVLAVPIDEPDVKTLVAMSPG